MSGLRYPGGKTRSVDLLKRFVPAKHNRFISPFIGGGSFEIELASHGTLLGFDIFKPLVVFWQWLLKDPAMLAARSAELMPVDLNKFKILRIWLIENIEVDSVDVAATYFVINRCSFSGSTLSGGFSAESAVKRFTQSSIDRIRNFTALNVQVNCQSFDITLLDPVDAFIFADPPYYTAKKLYGVDGEGQNIDHTLLRDLIIKQKDWMITYDDCPEIRILYDDYTFIKVAWAYGMNKSKKSNEVLILSDSVILDLWIDGRLEFGSITLNK
jgi:DNA adenine methylase